jgi:hypothetical protein
MHAIAMVCALPVKVGDNYLNGRPRRVEVSEPALESLIVVLTSFQGARCDRLTKRTQHRVGINIKMSALTAFDGTREIPTPDSRAYGRPRNGRGGILSGE